MRLFRISPEEYLENYSGLGASYRDGARWLQKCTALAMIVPSTAVPGGLERIAVVNPRHPDCKQLKLVRSLSDLYNKRAFAGL